MILFERSIPIPAARSRTAHPFDILQHAAGEHEALRQSNNSRRRRRSHNSSIIIPRSEGQFRRAPAFGGHRVSDTSLAEWHSLSYTITVQNWLNSTCLGDANGKWGEEAVHV